MARAKRTSMAVEVLKHRGQIVDARAELKRRGIDCASTLPQRVLRRLGMLDGVNVGDRTKSWDVLKTVRFVEDNIAKDRPLLDIGASSCEILPILDRLDYSNLAGIDLDPKVGRMPHAERIRYVVGDFMTSPFPGESFDCVTAVSVIEHGFDGERLLSELSRILSPGGYFVASVDYWPEKMKTNGVTAYGMEWLIFSRDELQAFIESAARYGFVSSGGLDFVAADRVVRWMGRGYTFAWLTLRKAV